MQPTKFQINFRNAVTTALEYKALTNKEAREYRQNFWRYNKEEHTGLYTTIMERIIERMKLVHLKRKLKDKKKLYTMLRATAHVGSVYRFY